MECTRASSAGRPQLTALVKTLNPSVPERRVPAGWFMNLVSKVSKTFALSATANDAIALRNDISFFQALQ